MAYNNSGGRSSFDLNKYETVKSRKVRLRNDFPDSVIMPFPLSDLNYASNYILMGALIWKKKKTFQEKEANILEKISETTAKTNTQNVGMVMASLALLLGADGVGYSLSMAGGKGADRNAWVENAEESAVGRALDNMGYHSGSASQEEMKKVEQMQAAQQTRIQLENQINSMYGTLMSQGHNPQYLTQVVNQTVRPFSQLNELSPEELEKLLGALQSINNQSAYQQQQQQQYQQKPSGILPGAPSPAVAR